MRLYGRVRDQSDLSKVEENDRNRQNYCRLVVAEGDRNLHNFAFVPYYSNKSAHRDCIRNSIQQSEKFSNSLIFFLSFFTVCQSERRWSLNEFAPRHGSTPTAENPSRSHPVSRLAPRPLAAAPENWGRFQDSTRPPARQIRNLWYFATYYREIDDDPNCNNNRIIQENERIFPPPTLCIKRIDWFDYFLIWWFANTHPHIHRHLHYWQTNWLWISSILPFIIYFIVSSLIIIIDEILTSWRVELSTG